jgi:hypothetical protein
MEAGGKPPQGGASTGDEAAAALEGELDSSSGEFDQRMREELQRLAAEAAAREGRTGSGGSGDSAGGAGEGTSGSAEESGGGGGSRTGAEEGDETSGAVGGSGPGATGSSEIPPDVGDGSDDDIVARQLREAAMAEKDPELREKLWDEYRRYKASVSGSKKDTE